MLIMKCNGCSLPTVLQSLFICFFDLPLIEKGKLSSICHSDLLAAATERCLTIKSSLRSGLNERQV